MARKYSKRASKKVERAMRERKRGELRSGRSGKKVTSRKQAIAIGLSEARRAGEDVPPPKEGRKKASKKKTKKKRAATTAGKSGRTRRATKKRSASKRKRSGKSKRRKA